jgi:ubiquinone/menaquinone biosynthesis C-methylase UbiE
MENTHMTHEVTVQEGYQLWAAQYDQEGNALIIIEEQLTKPLLASIPATHVLDLGTGTGRYAICLAEKGAQVVALDQSEAMLSLAQQAATQTDAKIHFLQQTLEKPLPSHLGNFDLVIAALVLCHVEDLASVADEAYRVLDPGGHFLVTDFHPAVIAAGWRTEFTHANNRYLLPTAQHTTEDYLAAFRDVGFHIQRVQEALVSDVPKDLFPADVIARDGDKPFCLAILATKPTHHNDS